MLQPTVIVRRFSAFCICFLLIHALSMAGRALNFQSDTALHVTGTEDIQQVKCEIGRFGGRLVISQRSEPKTLNPLIAMDGASQEIIRLLMADLIHINRYSQQTEAGLALAWTVSSDRRQYKLHLRRGLRFSDGYPFDADDVVFTFQCYLDERVHSPQRDLLVVSGTPIAAQKIDQHTVLFTLAQPYAAAERLFDSIDILPRHLLQRSYAQAKLASAWSLSVAPQQIAGLGPFRFKEYVPGQYIVLERNPYYWKKDLRGETLPYLDTIESIFAANSGAEAMRFEAGETDIISRLDASDFSVLEKDEQHRGFHLYDLGPGLEYDFLFFNQNTLGATSWPSLISGQSWFRQTSFRQAISSAIDRDSIVRLAYQGRARPLSVPVTAGNKLWVDKRIPPPARSLERSRRLLRKSGFSWSSDGSLLSSRGTPVTFSITLNAAKPEQAQMAGLIQQDLKELGITVTLDALDFRTFLDRIFSNFKYESAIMALADGDSDPNSELNVWSSNGTAHVWSLRSVDPPPRWQMEIDRLMQEQLTAANYQQRKQIFDRVQENLWENVPVICLITPDILVGAKDRIGNFRPAILSSHTLWNAEQLFIRR
jgi:peptide/nickel transport system substrate-binding protein